MEYLADALQEFGIIGDFSSRKISHDELDAITSAIVGIFFWTGKFEAIGNPDEEYLIIPDLSAKTDAWNGRRVFGFSGAVSTIKQIIPKPLSGLYSYRQMPGDKPMAPIDGTNIIRRSLSSEMGLRFTGRRNVVLEVFGKISKKTDLLIEGLQSPEDHALMVEIFGPRFRHVHIETDSEPATLINAVRESSPNKTTNYQNSHDGSDSECVKPFADCVIFYNGQNTDLISQLDSALKGTGG